MCHQMDRPLRGGLAAKPFRRREPGRMRGTIRIPEAADDVRGDLDPPRRRAQPMALGIAPKILEQDVVLLGRRQLDETFGPELLETGQRRALARRLRAHSIVDRLAPAQLVAVFGEGVLVAETTRKR